MLRQAAQAAQRFSPAGCLTGAFMEICPIPPAGGLVQALQPVAKCAQLERRVCDQRAHFHTLRGKLLRVGEIRGGGDFDLRFGEAVMRRGV